MKKNQNIKKSLTKWRIITFIFFLLFVASIIFIFYRFKISSGVNNKNIKSAAKIIGLQFKSEEINQMKDGVKENLKKYNTIRKYSIKNSKSPAFNFSPLFLKSHIKDYSEKTDNRLTFKYLERPADIEDLAFASLDNLAYLIRTQKVSSVELTKMYLKRLKEYGPGLKCVVTLTEDLALKQAIMADKEIAAGRYKGKLHGIPWGAKDLIATKNIKTTWGAMPFKDQIPDYNATIVQKLNKAGAVLVAKLTTGALAWGDVWYGGKTKNPWDLKQGSSGSSAGPASATSAGLVGFSIGTETWGSIISPSTRCGVTGLRPTFGRVSRYGIMALSWTMDKAGPICRTAEGCGIVFKKIVGKDKRDPSTISFPFEWPVSKKISELRIGYLKSEFDKDYENKKFDKIILDKLENVGINLIPLELPEFPVNSLSFILNVEAAAAFDELTRSNMDDMMVRQVKNAWPNVFRHSRLVPAVEYIQANRLRRILMEEMNEKLENIDLYIAPTYGNPNLLLTNLTGHPSLVIPNGFDKKGHPVSITLTGNLLAEAEILMVGKAIQEVTGFHLQNPSF